MKMCRSAITLLSFAILCGQQASSAEPLSLADLVDPATKPVVLGEGYGFCEGPTADAQGNVYFSDGKTDSIYFYEVGKKPTRWVSDSTDANGQKINSRGELYTCEGAAYRIVVFDVKTRTKRVLCEKIDGKHFNEPNDLAIDAQDGCYFTDPCYSHRGQKAVMKQDVYYCTREGKVSRVSDLAKQPNGILLSADGKTLFIADCAAKRLYKYEVLAPGKLANPVKWADLAGHPDGLALDERGNLYAACGPVGVQVLSPQGALIGAIRVPYASNVCFGDADFKTLYVTSADKFLAVKMKIAGLKPWPLRTGKE